MARANLACPREVTSVRCTTLRARGPDLAHKRSRVEPQPGAGNDAHTVEPRHQADSQDGVGDFVAWVRSEIDRRGISQRMLAHQAGINNSMVSRLLSREYSIQLATAAALARALGGQLAVHEVHPMTSRCPECGHVHSRHRVRIPRAAPAQPEPDG